MRILHTSDWHLNDKLNRHERQPDLCARMVEIATILRDESVDAMLIAGDLFADRVARLSELRGALTDMLDAFRGFLDGGGTIVAISGNHDSEDLFELLRSAQNLTTRVALAPGQAAPPGRLYLSAKPAVLTLEGRDGQRVQVALQPYPTPSLYLSGKGDPEVQSAAERNDLLHRRAVDLLAQQVKRCASQPLPSVLLAHAHVRNSLLSHSLYRIEERDDVVFNAGDLPGFAYTALGHIHRPQRINDCDNVRYSGSIERMDAAERDEGKGVVLVDIGPVSAGPAREIPLDATPILDEEISGPADLAALQEKYTAAQRERAYLRYLLRCRVQDEAALHRDVRRLFPRWYTSSAEHTDGKELRAEAQVSSARLRDTAGTARTFVDERLRDHPYRADVLRRLDGLLESLREPQPVEVRP